MRKILLSAIMSCITIATFPNAEAARVLGRGAARTVQQPASRQPVCTPQKQRAISTLQSVFSLPHTSHAGVNPKGREAIHVWTKDHDLAQAQVPMFSGKVAWTSKVTYMMQQLQALHDTLEAMRAARLYAPPPVVRRLFTWDTSLTTDAGKEAYKTKGAIIRPQVFLSFTASKLPDRELLDKLVSQANYYQWPYPGIYEDHPDLLKSDSVLTLKTCGTSSRLRDITLFSVYVKELEALMLPGTQFKITSYKEITLDSKTLAKKYPTLEGDFKKQKDGSVVLREIEADEICEELPAGMASSPDTPGSDRTELEALIKKIHAATDEKRKKLIQFLKSGHCEL